MSRGSSGLLALALRLLQLSLQPNLKNLCPLLTFSMLCNNLILMRTNLGIDAPGARRTSTAWTWHEKYVLLIASREGATHGLKANIKIRVECDLFAASNLKASTR